MKSVGSFIKEIRVKKRISKEKLAELTKIKKQFIDLIEKERWELLPEYPIVVGFVKSIAGSLGVKEEYLVALLRRDYPSKTLLINPKPEIAEKFTWNPRLTFITGVIIAVFLVIGYLIFQYSIFINPPELLLETPMEGEVVSQGTLIVKGKTNPEATVYVNNQPTLVEEDGRFTAEIEVTKFTQEIVVKARSRSGKETIVSRKIRPELE